MKDIPTIRIPARILFIAVILLVFLSHFSYLNNGFTWLDHGDIESGKAFIHAKDLGQILTNRYAQTGFYRPAVTLMHTLDKSIYGLWAPGYHLTNVLLHVGASIAAVLFISSFIPLSPIGSLVVLLIFGIHPLSWLPVGAISYRQEIMLALCMYLSVWAYATNRNKGHDLFGILAVIMAFLALLSKETALVILPVYIMLWELKDGIRQMKRLTTQTIAMWIGCIVVGVAYIIMRYRAVPEIWKLSYPHLSLWEGIIMRLNVLGLRMTEVMSPFKPHLSDAVQITSIPDLYGWIALLILIVTVIVGCKKKMSLPIWILLGVWAVSMLPALNLVPLPRFSSPHYGYILIAPTLLLLYKASDVKILKSVFIYVAAFWIIVASYNTYMSGYRFQNDETLFVPEVATDQHFLEGTFYLGDVAWKQKDLKSAEAYYRKAYAPDPHYLAYVDRTSLLINYAGVLIEEGKPSEALPLLEEAHIQVTEANKSLIIYDMARVYYQQKNYKKVIELLERDDITWARSEPYMMLAMSYYYQKDYKMALGNFKNALPYVTDKGKKQLMDFVKKKLFK